MHADISLDIAQHPANVLPRSRVADAHHEIDDVLIGACRRNRADGIAVGDQLLPRILHVDDRRLAGNGDRLRECADPEIGVDVAVAFPVSSTPSRRNVLNPVSVNVTEYVPGRRSTIRY